MILGAFENRVLDTTGTCTVPGATYLETAQLREPLATRIVSGFRGAAPLGTY